MEHLNGLFGTHLVSAEKNIFLYDFPHSSRNGIHIGLDQLSAVTLVQRAEITLGNRPSDHYSAIREHILRSLA